MTSPIEAQLSRLRGEAEEREAKRLAEKLNLPYLDLSKKPIEVESLKLISEDEARGAKVAVIEAKGDDVILVALDPNLPEAQKVINQLTSKNHKLKIYITSPSALEQSWSYYKYLPKETSPAAGRMDIEKERLEDLTKKLTVLGRVQEEVDNFDFKTYPTAALLEVILAGALANGASDIHFEPEVDNTKIRYRIDGLLYDAVNLTPDFYKLILSRIKFFSGLQINVTNKPQDGRFTVGLTNKSIEVRISVVPSEYGETAVMRVLDPEAISVSLEQLGLRPDDLAIVEEELAAPNGMILNTGPTGSGKTTTLYAFLKKKQASEIKIITIEDPIEYHLEGIEQTQVKEQYSFANGLRSIMRQDPDVILVGEIRDQETAEIAVQAALTGHLVFSTVHANEAAGAIPRLLDLNVKDTSIGPALNLIMAQRLIRRLCDRCKKTKEPAPELKEKIEQFLKNLPARMGEIKLDNIQFFQPTGCADCNNSGYKGRVGVFELLKVDEKVEDLIRKHASESEMQNFAVANGMVTMQQDGILKALRGITTLEEVEAVTGHWK